MKLLGNSNELVIIKPTRIGYVNFSGDDQAQTAGKLIDNPLRVQVLRNGKPVQGVWVYFEFVTVPKNNDDYRIIKPASLTDSLGMAETYVKLGHEDGLYEVVASLRKEGKKTFTIFQLIARQKNWVFLLIMGLLGGLGLFLFGMYMMSEGMQKSAGNKMRSILSSLTNNRFVSVGVGAFVTMLIQSSSATSVMLVSFVNSRLMKFKQTLGVILGAAIGTTITAQLIAFKLTDYALLLIGIGFFVYFFASNY
ncbi:MAG: Na/Pi symporter, partial [bacterium]